MKAVLSEKGKEKVKARLSIVRGFRHFISDYGIVPLAVAVVIGTSVNDLVKSLVDDLITPFIALVSPQGKLQNLQFQVDGVTFKLGHALNATLSFLVVAMIVYLVAKLVLRNDELLKKK